MTGDIAWVHLVTRIVEIVGTAIIVVGSSGALAAFPTGMARSAMPRDAPVSCGRSNLGLRNADPVPSAPPDGLRPMRPTR